MPNGSELGKYYIQIIPTTEGISGQIEKELDKGGSGAEKAGESIGGKLASGFGSAVKAMGTAVVAATSAAVAATSKLIKDTAEYGDKIDKASQKIGISAEAYQEWDFIAQHSGTSMDSLTASFRTLQVAAANGSEEFQALNISAEQVAGMTTEELFGAVIGGLQNMEEGAERTALATKLLGRGAMELGPLLNTSAEDTEAMRQQVHDLGGVMSSEAVKAGAQFQDSLQNVQTSMNGLTRNFATKFLPGVSQAMDGLAAIFSGDKGGIEQLRAGIQDFSQNLLSLLPEFVDAVMPIFEGLLTAIIDNLPMLLDVGVKIVETVIGMLPTIIEKIVAALPVILPELISGVIQLIVSLVAHLPEIIHSIIQALPTIIESIIVALLDNLPILIEGVIQLVAGLVQELPTILLAIWETLKRVFGQIFGRLRDFFVQHWETIKGVFRNAINGIIWLINKAIDGINALLTPFRAIIAGFGQMIGLNWTMDNVALPHIPMMANGGILSQGAAIVGEKGPELLQVCGGQAKVTPLSGNNTNLGGVTINVYAADGQDPRAIAEAVSEELARSYESRRAVFA